MANTTIQIKRSGTSSSVPADLNYGELAINYADGKLYYKNTSDIIAEISGAAQNFFGTINANGYLIVADSADDIVSLIPGNYINITGDTINDAITISADISPAFDQANTALITASAAYDTANAAASGTNDLYARELANSNFITVQAAYDQANAAPGIANSYTDSVATNIGTGANSYTDTVATNVGTGANSYADTVGTNVGTGANSYADTVGTNVGTGANSYALSTATSIGASGNAYALATATSVGTSGNSYALSIATSVGAASNSYAIQVGASGNSYTDTVATNVGTGANSYADTVGTNVGTGANSYSVIVGASSNAYAELIGTSANGYSDTKLSLSGGTVTGDLSVVGDLNVSGNTYYVSVEEYRVGDPLIYLAGNNYTSDIVDIGFIANYNNGAANLHTGIFRDHDTKEYYVFYGYTEEPVNNHIDPNGNNFTIGVLNADLRTSNLNLGGTNTITWITASYDQANAAPGIANSYTDTVATNVGTGANSYADLVSGAAYNQANSATTTASAAYDQANSATTLAAAAYDQANTGGGGATIYEDQTDATRYLTFADATSGSFDNANVDVSLTYNPSSNNLTVGNTVFATHFDNTSDRNLKENIEPIVDGSVILHLDPVTFNWKATGEKSYGLIAQDVEKLIPEIVHTNDNGIKAIEYIQLISLLITMVQSQQQQIDDINNRINNMPSNP
jgi:hypothetical protein